MKSKYLIVKLLTATVAIASAGVCSAAGLIDFETVPGDMPRDNMVISNQYLAEFGVAFALDGDGDGLPDPGRYPWLEKVGGGDSKSGFSCDHRMREDYADHGFEERLGTYFLRCEAVEPGVFPSALIVLYAAPVSTVTGEIWDIDGTTPGNAEQWLVEATDANPTNVLASTLSPNGADLTNDGRPWVFSLSVPEPVITRLYLRPVGTKTDAFGLAFKNFSPSASSPALPRLQIALKGTNVAVSWPTDFSDYTLEATAALVPNAAWTQLTDTAAVSGPDWTVTELVAGTAKFYRLRKNVAGP